MKLYIQLFLLFLIIPSCCLSAKTTYQQATQKKNSFDLQLEQIRNLAATNIDSAIRANQALIEWAQKSGTTTDYWESCILESDLFLKTGQSDTSIVILKKIKAEATEVNDTIFQIRILTKLANCEQKRDDFKKTIVYLITAQKLFNANTPSELQVEVYWQLGNIHRRMLDYPTAIRYFRFIENEFSNQLSPRQKYMFNNGMGNVYLELKEYSKAEPFCTQAYELNNGFPESEKHPEASFNLGLLYMRLKQYPKALAFTKTSMELAQKQGNKTHLAECYRILGGIYYLQTQYQEAEVYYKQALDLAKQTKQPQAIVGNYRNLYLNSYFWAQQTNSIELFKQAYAYEKTWNNLRDSLYQADLANQLLDLEKKYESDKKNAQIELLSKDNLIKQEELVIEQQQRRFLFLVILLLSVVVVVVLYFFLYFRKVSRTLRFQGALIMEQKEQISIQNTELQKAITTRDKLFSIIAHDLRSPLVSMSNFVRLLHFYLHDGKYDSIQRMAIDMDKKNQQVLQLTDNLLSWAQSQSGALNPKPEQIQLKQLLDECYQLYLPIAERKQIDLQLAATTDCLVWADRDMLQTVCRNLISNALKFTPQQGQIRIESVRSESEAWILVADSGIGISADKQQRLFSLNKSDVLPGTDGEKSTGLGLSLCKEFTEAMKGAIKVESQEGKGSTFSFSVPLA